MLLESDKLTREELLALTCRDKYCIKSVMFNSPRDRDDELYRIFGDMVGQTVDFMRYWLRVHVLTHKHQIAKFAKVYLESKGLNISTWLTRPKTGKRADVLALFLLCKITKSHCFIHLEGGCYWTSLEENPDDHDTLLQKCSLHLAYLGCGNYAQLLLRTVTYEYKIFGVSSPLNIDVIDTKPQIIGSLTVDEESQLLNTGLKPNSPPTQKKVSASIGLESDLKRVKRELAIPTSHTGRKVPHSSMAIKLSVEPLVKVRKISRKDILLAQQRVREEYSILRSTANARKKSDKTKQVKRSEERREDTLMWQYINYKKENVNIIISAKSRNVLHHLAKHQHGTCTT